MGVRATLGVHMECEAKKRLQAPAGAVQTDNNVKAVSLAWITSELKSISYKFLFGFSLKAESADMDSREIINHILTSWEVRAKECFFFL